MFSTPRRRSREASDHQPAEPHHPPTPRSSKKRLSKGRYSDGLWWCNCEPRNKASLREVKKAGPNKGRFYWKCDHCEFFLWWNEAKARETGLSSNEGLAEAPKPKTPALTQQSLVSYGYQITPGRRRNAASPGDMTDSDEESGPDTPAPKPLDSSTTGAPPAGVMETPSRGSAKRTRDVFEDDEGEFSDLGSDEERQMAAMADKSAQKAAAQRRYTTPSSSRSVDVIAGLPTPSVSRTLFPGTESKRQKQVSFEDAPSRHTATLSPATMSASTTPSKGPSGLQAVPSSSPPDAASYDVTDEIMGLLQGQDVDPTVLHSVRDMLVMAARRTKGLVLGRDSARATLKARDEEIATLQDRITALENRDRMHRSQMTNIKANLMKMYDDN